ncbi:uncharacterized protein LOC131928906 [Physella acuta]|uniref:uncharacterized protein LOC131928906 n=1 Tax=Physella acuta TaxID=109671 RepID=UPI0027DD8D58|nr:uncharacterized protein LOC131928906 [Physella acuta]
MSLLRQAVTQANKMYQAIRPRVGLNLAASYVQQRQIFFSRSDYPDPEVSLERLRGRIQDLQKEILSGKAELARYEKLLARDPKNKAISKEIFYLKRRQSEAYTFIQQAHLIIKHMERKYNM